MLLKWPKTKITGHQVCYSVNVTHCFQETEKKTKNIKPCIKSHTYFCYSHWNESYLCSSSAMELFYKERRQRHIYLSLGPCWTFFLRDSLALFSRHLRSCIFLHLPNHGCICRLPPLCLSSCLLSGKCSLCLCMQEEYRCEWVTLPKLTLAPFLNPTSALNTCAQVLFSVLVAFQKSVFKFCHAAGLWTLVGSGLPLGLVETTSLFCAEFEL